MNTFTLRTLQAPILIVGVFAAVFSLLFFFVKPWLAHNLVENDGWVKRATKDDAADHTNELLKAGIATGIIRYVPRTGVLKVTTEREYEIEFDGAGLSTGNSDGSGSYGSTDRIMKRLWRARGEGSQLRKEIDRFNNIASFAAVRSDGATLRACTTTGFDEDCAVQVWHPEMLIGTDNAAPATRLSNLDPEIDVFGRLAIDKIENFDPWRGVASPTNHDATLRFTATGQRSDQTPVILPSNQKRKVRYVEVVGRRAELTIGQSTAPPVKRSHFCVRDDGRGIKSCKNVDKAIATRFDLRNKTVADGLTVRVQPINLAGFRRNAIEQQSVYSAASSVGANLFIQNIDKQDDGRSYRLTPRISLLCGSRKAAVAAALLVSNVAAGRRVCVLHARERSNKRSILPRNDDTEEILTSASGEGNRNTRPWWKSKTTTDGTVTLSDTAVQYGLQSVFGRDSHQLGSWLASTTRKSRGGSDDPRPTIDPKIQKIVSDVFRSTIINKNTFNGLPRKVLSDSDDKFRRAAFILMDITDVQSPGKISAIATYPQYDGGLSKWDLDALSRVKPSANPVAPHGWRHLETDFTPGSVFKLVSALSMIDLAVGLVPARTEEVSTLAKKMLIGLNASQFKATTGHSFDALTYNLRNNLGPDADFTPVGDADKNTITDGLKRIKATRKCPAAPAGANSYGLCSAIIRSSNMWFSSVLTKLEEDVLRSALVTPLQSARPLALDYTTRRLGLRPDAVNSIPNGEVQNTVSQGHLRCRGGSSLLLDVEDVPSDLCADAIVLGVVNAAASGSARDRRFVALENGLASYGQGPVQASVLQIAKVSASIATERLVRPTLDENSSYNAKLLYPSFVFEKAAPLLERLRSGMHGVVNLSGGSAYKAFHSVAPDAEVIAKRVFGKTGTPTLTVQGRKIEGSWFTGYILDRDPNPTSPGSRSGNGKPKWAFACAISHVNEHGSRLCSAMTARILTKLSADN